MAQTLIRGPPPPPAVAAVALAKLSPRGTASPSFSFAPSTPSSATASLPRSASPPSSTTSLGFRATLPSLPVPDASSFTFTRALADAGALPFFTRFFNQFLKRSEHFLAAFMALSAFQFQAFTSDAERTREARRIYEEYLSPLSPCAAIVDGKPFAEFSCVQIPADLHQRMRGMAYASVLPRDIFDHVLQGFFMQMQSFFLPKFLNSPHFAFYHLHRLLVQPQFFDAFLKFAKDQYKEEMPLLYFDLLHFYTQLQAPTQSPDSTPHSITAAFALSGGGATPATPTAQSATFSLASANAASLSVPSTPSSGHGTLTKGLRSGFFGRSDAREKAREKALRDWTLERIDLVHKIYEKYVRLRSEFYIPFPDTLRTALFAAISKARSSAAIDDALLDLLSQAEIVVLTKMRDEIYPHFQQAEEEREKNRLSHLHAMSMKQRRTPSNMSSASASASARKLMKTSLASNSENERDSKTSDDAPTTPLKIEITPSQPRLTLAERISHHRDSLTGHRGSLSAPLKSALRRPSLPGAGTGAAEEKKENDSPAHAAETATSPLLPSPKRLGQHVENKKLLTAEIDVPLQAVRRHSLTMGDVDKIDRMRQKYNQRKKIDAVAFNPSRPLANAVAMEQHEENKLDSLPSSPLAMSPRSESTTSTVQGIKVTVPTTPRSNGADGAHHHRSTAHSNLPAHMPSPSISISNNSTASSSHISPNHSSDSSIDVTGDAKLIHALRSELTAPLDDTRNQRTRSQSDTVPQSAAPHGHVLPQPPPHQKHRNANSIDMPKLNTAASSDPTSPKSPSRQDTSGPSSLLSSPSATGAGAGAAPSALLCPPERNSTSTSTNNSNSDSKFQDEFEDYAYGLLIGKYAGSQGKFEQKAAGKVAGRHSLDDLEVYRTKRLSKAKSSFTKVSDDADAETSKKEKKPSGDAPPHREPAPLHGSKLAVFTTIRRRSIVSSDDVTMAGDEANDTIGELNHMTHQCNGSGKPNKLSLSVSCSATSSDSDPDHMYSPPDSHLLSPQHPERQVRFSFDVANAAPPSRTRDSMSGAIKSIMKKKVRKETFEEVFARVYHERQKESARFLSIMKSGAQLHKYDGMGKPAERWVWVTDEGADLCWAQKDKKSNQIKSSIFNRPKKKALADVVRIKYGSTSSMRFQRYNSQKQKPWLAFSIFFADRTVDLVFPDDATVTVWFIGLQSLAPLSTSYLTKGGLLWKRLAMKIRYFYQYHGRFYLGKLLLNSPLLKGVQPQPQQQHQHHKAASLALPPPPPPPTLANFSSASAPPPLPVLAVSTTATSTPASVSTSGRASSSSSAGPAPGPVLASLSASLTAASSAPPPVPSPSSPISAVAASLAAAAAAVVKSRKKSTG